MKEKDYNISNTNNYYNSQNSHLHSHLIQYDGLKDVILDGAYMQLYGMVLSVVYKQDKNGSHIETVRIPLKGEQLEPLCRYSDSRLTDENLIFLPEDKVLGPEIFRCIINNLERENMLEVTLKNLKKAGYTVQADGEYVDFEISIVSGGFWIECKYFTIFIKTRKVTYITPKELENLCYLLHILDKPFRFILNEEKTNEKHKQLTKEVARMMAAYDQYGFRVSFNGKVYYDGTYLYNGTQGKTRMTTDEFNEKYPNSYPLIEI